MPLDPYRAAKDKVKKKKGFYGHLTAYCVVNVVMFFVILLNEGSFEWLIPMSFWGIGLVIHYFSVFGLSGKGGYGTKEWEEKEIRKELEKQGYEPADFEIDDYEEEDLDLEDLRDRRLRERQAQKRSAERQRGWRDEDLV